MPVYRAFFLTFSIVFNKINTINAEKLKKLTMGCWILKK